MEIELLTVPGCPHRDAAAALISNAVAVTGVRASVTETTIASAEQAEERGFQGSPTILLNGVDPFVRPDAPTALACRLYQTSDGLRGVPALPDLCRGVRQLAQRCAG